MTAILAPLLLGLAFGALLHRGGLTHYARIVNVYRLRDLTVLRFMLAALVVGALGIQAGLSLGLTASAPVPLTALAANLVGGIVFGIGMATAGYCPGTIVAEAGEGRLDAWVAGFGGLLVGALVFAALQPTLVPALAQVGAVGRVTLAELVGASPWLVLVVFAQLVVIVLLLVRGRATG